MFNIVQAGGKFGRAVVSQVGRVHYGGIRLIGTTGRDPAAAMSAIPATAEIRPNDKINIIGAAGPMGTMHVIRDLCQGVPGVTVFAGDLSDERLAALQKLAEPLAAKNKLTLRPYNPSKEKLPDQFNYIVLMAPVPALVAQAVQDAAPGGIINIFAGIPADKTADLDLDAYIEKQLYFIGTSGSVLDDMKLVLAKVVSRQLDTNLSVAAVAGLDGAIDGIRAVEKNLMPGKILVYPSCRGLKLTPLTELGGSLPLSDGHWNKQAEEALVKQFPNNMSADLKNKIAIVTGGAQGLGQAISLRLAREGCQVVIADVNEKGVAETAAAIAAETAGCVLGVKVDVTQEADVKMLFDRAAQEFGRVDIVVANAAILIAEPIADADAEKWRAVMNVNLFGYFLVTKYACRVMKEPGGRFDHQHQFQIRQEGQRRQLRLRRQQVRRHRPHPERRAGNGPVPCPLQRDLPRQPARLPALDPS